MKSEKDNVVRLYSALLSRAGLAAKLGYSYEGDRDLYTVLGYQTDLTITDYYTAYERHDIAKAVINRPVLATWRGGFRVVETDDDEETEFEKAWSELYDSLKLGSIFVRLDKLTGLGSYGILLMGFDDVKTQMDFAKPVQGKRSLLYVRPYSGMPMEGNAQIAEYVEDTSDPRYGKPLIYNINAVNLYSKVSSAVRVHYSRVIHVMDEMLESEVEGTPRLEAVFNRLKDLEKIVGGSAEMFWRGARPGYQGKVDPEYTLTPDSKAELQDQMDEFEHKLRRMLLNEGVTWEALASQVIDPSPHVDVQIQMISAVTGIPKRVLTGSERGELASSQDRDNWFDLVEFRREEFAEPFIIRQFIDSLVENKAIPAPKGGYSIIWKDLRTPSDQDKAQVGSTRASALKDYSSSQTTQDVFPIEAFYRFCLGLSDEEIEMVEVIKEKEMEEELLLEEPPFEEPPFEEPPFEEPPPLQSLLWSDSARRSAALARKGMGGADDSEIRRQRAKDNYKPATKEKQRKALENEKKVASHIGGTRLGNNEPFDVLKKGHAIEVKTVFAGANPKITIHPSSLTRKIDYSNSNKVNTWTVVVDTRGGGHEVYLKKGVGSFRLSNMKKLNSFEDLLKEIK